MLYRFFMSIAKKRYPVNELDNYAHPAEIAAHHENEVKQHLKQSTYVDGSIFGVFIGILIGAALCTLIMWVF